MKKILILALLLFLTPSAQAIQTQYSDGTPTGYLPNGRSIYKDYDNAQLDYLMLKKYPKVFKRNLEDFERNKPKIYVNKFVKMEPTLNAIDSNQQDINDAIKDVVGGVDKL